MRKRPNKSKSIVSPKDPKDDAFVGESLENQRPTESEPRRKGNRHHLCVVLLFSVYFVLPVVLRYSYFIQSLFIYVNFIPIPLQANLSSPSDFGLANTHHDCIPVGDHERVCYWHLLPVKYSKATVAANQFSSYLEDGSPIVIYAHGNTGSRAVHHRVEICKLLARRDVHVISFDYRGFGDSIGVSTESGLTDDLMLMWNWTLSRTAPKAKVYLYGHSLGSAPVSHLAGILGQHESLGAVLLDAPYTSIPEAASHHPFGIPYWPFMSLLIRDHVFQHIHERFPVVKHVRKIQRPLLVVHGQWDIIIPYHLGYAVFRSAKDHGQSPNVTFHDCGNSGHKKNYLCPVFSSVLDSFLK